MNWKDDSVPPWWMGGGGGVTYGRTSEPIGGRPLPPATLPLLPRPPRGPVSLSLAACTHPSQVLCQGGRHCSGQTMFLGVATFFFLPKFYRREKKSCKTPLYFFISPHLIPRTTSLPYFLNIHPHCSLYYYRLNITLQGRWIFCMSSLFFQKYSLYSVPITTQVGDNVCYFIFS